MKLNGVPRGTTFYGVISLTNEDKKTYTIGDAEKIVVGLKDDPDNDKYIIKKILTNSDEINGKYPFIFSPEETDIQVDRYWLGAAVFLSDGNIQDVEECGEFEIRRSVVRRENNHGN